ncbi:GTPase IMAP family member 7-like [Maylandia zebra]|uniref:GTPase IMAP family member 7-like n=1 Tax=Maylandia zebra TaxID=106582 RepID=UPI00403D4049
MIILQIWKEYLFLFHCHLFLFFIDTENHFDTKVNLVLLGMTGTGKSASGNTILGKKFFKCKPSTKPVTTECQVAESKINGIHVRVIDNPDIFDDDINPRVWDTHVKKCKQLCESEPCVYLLVMQASRFTDGERNIIEKLEKAFASKVRKQTIILFTRGDDLHCANIKLEDFLHSCQPGLKEIIQKCDNRCVVFENSRPTSHQVAILMEKVIRMIQEQQQ